MNWYAIFYLFSLSDKIACTFFVLSIIFSILFAISMIVFIAIGANVNVDEKEKSEDLKITRKWIFRFMLLMFIAWSFWAFIPNKKDMVLIIAGGSVGSFLQADSSVKKLPSDLTLYLHTAIQEEIKDMKIDTVVKQQLGIKTEKEELIDRLKRMSKEEIINYYTEKDTVR